MNGLEMITRVIDKRPTWNLTITNFVSGNAYPVTSAIALRNE